MLIFPELFSVAAFSKQSKLFLFFYSSHYEHTLNNLYYLNIRRIFHFKFPNRLKIKFVFPKNNVSSMNLEKVVNEYLISNVYFQIQIFSQLYIFYQNDPYSGNSIQSYYFRMRCFIFSSTVKTQHEKTSIKLALISYFQNKKRHATYLAKTHQLDAQNIHHFTIVSKLYGKNNQQ